ncbi:MAG: hypothetical protein JSV05_07185 [Candidatus Bathyarchaeota archaeon]|nr:MAG: hypothetical protein JSV05_07185 [Candidatus Bathyarchaeota archaeon]
MSPEYELITGEFQHLILEGSPYEVGQMQGAILKRNEAMRVRVETTISSFLTQLGIPSSEKAYLKMLGFEDFKELKALFEEYCPGLNDEMQGFADTLGIKVSASPFYSPNYQIPGNCSQVVVLSSVTNDKHVYVGRSYEWIHSQEDLRLCTTRVEGKAKHTGFSIFLFGRADGVNEHGIGATFTGGGIFGRPLQSGGFQGHLVIRAILDNCKSVDEAVGLIQKMPISGFFNLLIADRKSNAALAEFADGTRDIKRIDNDSADKCLFSTNHYTLPATAKANESNCGIIRNSQKRYHLIDSSLKASTPAISKETLRTILSRKFPEGVCDHYYSDNFGTLWSSIFDLTMKNADICFGAPTHNEWQEFTLDTPIDVRGYPAIFPNRKDEWPY